MLNPPLWGLIKELVLNAKEKAATNHQHPDLFPKIKKKSEGNSEMKLQ